MSQDMANVRFYEKDMPDINDLVMVKITQVNETSAYVQLLEYGHIEGMIPYTELSRRRIRSIAKLVKIGKLEVAQVLRLDRNKGYIDLSKKAVTPEERSRCEEKFNKAKVVHSIMRHCAVQCQMNFLELQKTVTWPLYRKYGHAHDALKLAVLHPDQVFAEEIEVSAPVRDHLEKTVRQKLKPQPARLRADLNVTCYKRAGIDAIREVLRLGIKEGQSEPAMDVNITIVSPPLYCVRTQTEDKETGLKKLAKIIEVMKQAMTERQGNIEILHHPRVVGDDGEDIRAAGEEEDSQSGGSSESESEDE